MISVSPSDPNTCTQQSINCKNASRKLTNGFKISKTKTRCMQLRKNYNNITLKPDGTEILIINQYKFLVMFYKKPNLQPPFTIKEKCSKVIKLLHVIAHREWGANQQT